MPPEPLEGNNYTLVYADVDILAILDIAEVDSYISMQLNIKLTWYAFNSSEQACPLS